MFQLILLVQRMHCSQLFVKMDKSLRWTVGLSENAVHWILSNKMEKICAEIFNQKYFAEFKKNLLLISKKTINRHN